VADDSNGELMMMMSDVMLAVGEFCLQEEPDEHGQGKWEGKQEGKSDKWVVVIDALMYGYLYM
jgi:hypothetical protein